MSHPECDCAGCRVIRERRHQHDWRPRSTFWRCHTCGVIGGLDGGVVVPYVCTVRGCGQLAVSRSRGTGQLCRGHQ